MLAAPSRWTTTSSGTACAPSSGRPSNWAGTPSSSPARAGCRAHRTRTIGVSNVAGVRWCATKAVLQSRADDPARLGRPYGRRSNGRRGGLLVRLEQRVRAINELLRGVVYDQPTWRRIQALADLRNQAAHGQGAAVRHEDVADAHQFVGR